MGQRGLLYAAVSFTEDSHSRVALPFETVTVYLPFSVREDSLMGGVDERAVRLKSSRPVFMACLHSSISRIPRAAVRVEHELAVRSLNSLQQCFLPLSEP